MTYIPMITLLATVVGGCWALAEITPVPVPPRVVMIGRLSGIDGLAFGRYQPTTTPPGDPSLFADVRCQRYVPHPDTLRKVPPVFTNRRIAPGEAGRFPAPVAPVFVHQARTPTTAEIDRVVA